MKKKISIAVLATILVFGLGLLVGKIFFTPKINDVPVMVESTDSDTVLPIVIDEKKVEIKKDNVTFTLVTPQVKNAPLLQEKIDAYTEAFVQNMTELGSEVDFTGASSNYMLDINYEVVRNDSKLVVIKLGAYEYTGGAHGNPSFAFFQYDVQRKRMIGKEDILLDKKDQKLLTLLTNRFAEKPQYTVDGIKGSKSMFFDLDEEKSVFMDNLAQNGQIAFTTQGVLFKYGAYEIGPYAIGEPEVEIEHTALTPFLTSYAKDVFQ